MRNVRMFLALVLLCATAATALAQGSNYRLQVGDRISIVVWQDERLNREITIAHDRNISMPLVGHINAVGRTLPELEQAIRQRLQPDYETELDISIALLGTEPTVVTTPMITAGTVSITGEVASPGQHPIQPSTTLMDAIAQAGGFGPFAATKRVQVRRRTVKGEELVYNFNYNAFEAGYGVTDNIVLRSGDLIIVPERWLFEFLE
jgi:polysaccharide biosynthesis/export protein